MILNNAKRCHHSSSSYLLWHASLLPKRTPPQSMFLTNSLSRQITYTSPGLMFCVRNEFTNFFFCMRKLIVLLCPKWNYWQNNLAMAISTSSKSATTTLLHNNMSLDPIHNPTANMGWIFLFYGRKTTF